MKNIFSKLLLMIIKLLREIIKLPEVHFQFINIYGILKLC